MADFKDERAYNSKTLTQVFLWSSFALLICVIWMVWKDYNRPWKAYQRQFMQLQKDQAQEQEPDALSDVDVAKFKKLYEDKIAAEKELDTHEAEIKKLNDQSASLDSQIFRSKTVDYQPLKAQIDADKYTYMSRSESGDENDKLKKKIDEETDQANAYTQRLFELGQQKDQVTQDLATIYARRDEVAANLAKIESDYMKLKTKVDKNSFSWLFYFRNAMLIDFLAPTIQIQQVVLKNLPEDLYFAKTMRVDRCMSCHLAIDKKGFENAPQPFRTHPNLDLYLGSASPHPMDKIGCTICHGGMGQALDFNTAAHVPNDDDQAKLWKDKYGWEQPEGVQSMMLPLKYTEGSCLKCHGNQEQVNFAPKLNRGRELMITRGCVDCHKVKNLEDVTKAGPSLLKVKGKLKEEFVEKWVWDPKSYNPAARMPSFFQQTNNSDPASLAKTKAELHAIVHYLYSHSEGYTPNENYPGGSASNGKKVFKEIGCLACHGIDDVTSFHADFAPDLSSVEKLSASFVYTWIKNPRHFNPDTRMPVLRLTSQEAADVTAYLMTKRNKAFEQASAPEQDPAVRDGLILDYLAVQNGTEGAKTQLAQMDDEAKEQYLAQKSLSKYGCFACHMIAGFENAQRIGTELSDWGTKRVSQIDFGITDLAHTHEAFANAKLENPRQFDNGKDVAFNDKLKMPNFHLSPEDKEAIVTALLGLTKTYVPDDMTAGIHGNGPLLEKGRRVIFDFNCRGCHLIEDQGGRIRQMYNKEGIDLSLAPPNLRKEGAKIQVEWFHDFLLNVHSIRPWLHIHMPSFAWNDEKIDSVITYFNMKEDEQSFPFKTLNTPKLSAAELTQTKAMFDKLQCKKCHIFGSQVPADLSSAAPDLLKVHDRLKPEWVLDWLKNPDALSPGVRMPAFWPQPDDKSPVPQYFHGDSAKQREMLRNYLFSLTSAK